MAWLQTRPEARACGGTPRGPQEWRREARVTLDQALGPGEQRVDFVRFAPAADHLLELTPAFQARSPSKASGSARR